MLSYTKQKVNVETAINNAVVGVLEGHALGTLSQSLTSLIPFFPVNF